MIEAWNYVADVRNRLLALIHYRRGLNDFCAVNNIAKVHDTDYRPLLNAKPEKRLLHEFPQIDVETGGGSDEGMSNLETIDLEPSDTIEIYRDFTAVITHAERNHDGNSQTELEVVAAWRNSGPKLALPNDNASALPYVIRWGPITTQLRPRRAYGGVRMETRATIRVYMQITQAEFEFNTLG